MGQQMPRLIHRLLALLRQGRKLPGRYRHKTQPISGYPGQEFSYGFNVVPRARTVLQGHWCLSFAAVRCLEAHLRKRHGNNFPALSVQHCIDEVGSTDVDEVADWLENEGVTEEKYYPFRVNRENYVFRGPNSYRRGWQRHKANIERPSKEFWVQSLRSRGPFVGLFWVTDDLDDIGTHYEGKGRKVYYNRDTEEFLGHAVLVIGYGKKDNGDGYWIYLENKGENWGLKGNGTATMNFDLFDEALVPYFNADPNK